MKRLLTALVLIPSVIYVIFLGPSLLFQAVVAALAIACFREYGAIAQAQKIPLNSWLGQAFGLLFLFAPRAEWLLLVAIAMMAATLAMRLENLADSLPSASALLFGLLYIYGAWRCAIVLHGYSAWWLFFAVSINWVGDSAALYSGKLFGKHKLAPLVSPKKTWEGALGSALFSTVYGVLLLSKGVPNTPPVQAAVLSFLACAAGQIGDLAESAMKRGAGVKDSGHMLPGHGGWLDRLDSTLFSMPVVAFYLYLVQ
jgi:phosphatidate cytidylyltransferase